MANDGITAKFPTTTVALTDFGGSHPPLSAPTTLILQTSLAAGDTSVVSTTTIPASFPAAGWITIDAEIIKYTSFAAATFTVTRGAQQTVAASHTANANIGLWFTPQELNQIESEVIAIQIQLGLGAFSRDGIGRWTYNWSGQLGLSAGSIVGSAAITVPATTGLSTSLQINTGTTSASTIGAARLIGFNNLGGTGKVRLARFMVTFNNIDANTNSWVYLTDELGSASPTNTARHVGLRQAGTVIFFSTGDNATEQTTDISAFITAAVAAFIDITYDGTTARCYVNGTLRATQTTNVPTSVVTQPTLKLYITNTAAANKILALDFADLVFSV